MSLKPPVSWEFQINQSGQGGRWASGNKVKEKQGRKMRKEKGREKGMERKMRGDSRRHGEWGEKEMWGESGQGEEGATGPHRQRGTCHNRSLCQWPLKNICPPSWTHAASLARTPATLFSNFKVCS